MLDPESLRIPLDGGVAMNLRASELASVAEGLGESDASARGNLLTLAAAVRSLPTHSRAPLWELAIRRYGRHKPLEQATAEIGLDLVRGRALLEAFASAVASVPAPESTSNL